MALSFRPIAILSAGYLLLLCATLGLGGLPLGTWVRFTTVGGIVGAALVTGAVWIGRRERIGPATLIAIGAVGIVCRLLLLPTDHFLSDDAFRYHWDGKVVSHGINPYRYAPIDEAVSPLRVDEIDALINHPDVVTVYPPLTQLLFAGGYRLTPGSLVGYRIICLAAEVLAWLLLVQECRRRRLPGSRILIAAWFPLVILESYLPGHTDALALPSMTAFLIAASRGWATRSGLFLALACLVKPVALIFLPAAVRELGPARSLRMAPPFLATLVAFYVPFRSAGESLFSSMLLMARKWEFNGSLAEILGEVVPPDLLRPVLAGLMLVIVLGGVRYGRDLVARALIAFAGLVICTPTLYPWYLIWGFPLLVLRPDPALLALAGLAPLVDLVVIEYYTSGIWSPQVWPSVAMYLPFYLLLALGIRRGWGMFDRSVPGP